MSIWIPGNRPQGLSLQFRRQRGFTLVEIMMSVVLLAISAALAIPSYREMVEKRQLTSAAEQLAAFVSSTQSISSRTNQVVTVSFSRNDHDDWCIGATLGSDACDCEETVVSESDFCKINSEPFILNQELANDAELVHGLSGSDSFSFDPIRGLFTNMDDSVTMEMHSKSSDYKLNLMVNASGRVTLCSNDSGHAIPGYDICPSVEEEGS